jgi:hypothetical protein
MYSAIIFIDATLPSRLEQIVLRSLDLTLVTDERDLLLTVVYFKGFYPHRLIWSKRGLDSQAGAPSIYRMSQGDPYRAHAAEFDARAEAESIPAARVEWMKIASAYYRLADSADKNPKAGLLVEVILPEPPLH